MSFLKLTNNYVNGNIKSEAYYLNNKVHNINGPAFISYFENGNINCKEYFLNNELHNEQGPSVIVYNLNGSIEYKAYYLNGEKINVNSDNEFKHYIKFLILK